MTEWVENSMRLSWLHWVVGNEKIVVVSVSWHPSV